MCCRRSCCDQTWCSRPPSRLRLSYVLRPLVPHAAAVLSVAVLLRWLIVVHLCPAVVTCVAAVCAAITTSASLSAAAAASVSLSAMSVVSASLVAANAPSLSAGRVADRVADRVAPQQTVNNSIPYTDFPGQHTSGFLWYYCMFEIKSNLKEVLRKLFWHCNYRWLFLATRNNRTFLDFLQAR